MLKSNSGHVKQQYITWLWGLLLSSAGKALVQVDTSDVEDIQELCLAEVLLCCFVAQRHVLLIQADAASAVILH